MKTVLGLLFATFLAFASGHHGGPGMEEHCHCGVFATTHDGLVEMDQFPHNHIADCSQEAKCKATCQEAWETYMGDGDLNHITDKGITVGQKFCNHLSIDHPDFGAHRVYGYSSICHGPLLYDNRQSQQDLCCTNGQYKPCHQQDTHFH